MTFGDIEPDDAYAPDDRLRTYTAGGMLTWLAEVLRAAGVTVVEYDGWTTRARSSGGYAHGRPWCVMWHHTASDTSPANDAAYMCTGSSDRPIANLLVARDGAVWVLAAGATNTNGKGGPLTFSRGTVPADSMNTYAVGMELANSGVGEPYPQAQIDAAFAASVAIGQALGLDPGDVGVHAVWAPDRKIDPATAAAVAGPWCPGAVNSSGSWSLEDLRAEHTRRWAGDPTPEPPQPVPPPPWEDDTMLWIAKDQTAAGVVWIGNNIVRRRITDPAVLQTYFDQYAAGGPPVYGAAFASTPGAVTRADDVVAVPDTTLEWLGEAVAAAP